MTSQAPEQINAAWRDLVRDRLAAFEVATHPVDDHHHAAVTLTLLDVGAGADLEGLPRHAVPSLAPAVLLTRRALTLRRHAGQWALPGGRLDPGETPEIAALRELHEEVGLQLGPDAILGRLDDFTSRSGFVITPVVVWAGRVGQLQPAPEEVASVHRVPVTELLRDDAPLLDAQPGSEQPVLRMPVGDTSIAAPTAALLYQFREVVLLQRATRVSHFEQPHFAWR